jgi:membrane fusion protein (multidrug efflux system)
MRNYAAAQEQLLAARQSAENARAEAQASQARANLAAAELDLSYTTIVAPVGGIVTNKNVEKRQIVQPGQG